MLVILGGLGTVAASAAVARRRVIHAGERDVFFTVNRLPRSLLPPVFVVMQAGNLAAVFVAAGLARLAKRPALATGMVVTGTAVWGGCKLVKGWVGRGRPGAHLEGVTIRGPAESGLGFPSGHTAVAFALAALAAPALPVGLRPPAWATAATVGVARIYVGAHLPLDVLGGAAIGLTAASAAHLAGA